MNMKLKTLCAALLLSVSIKGLPASYPLPPATDSLIGAVKYGNVKNDDNVVKIAMRYDVGFNALQNANPQYNLAAPLPLHAALQIPTQHVLPNMPRQGIVVNLPEMRLYYYKAGTNEVYTYPIGIGKIGKTIPITITAVTYKKENPNWIAPADIREYDLKQGLIVPQVVPPGPDNPLGPYAIYMRLPTYLIHSTIFPESIGKRASFGCIRMYPFDIKSFFYSVQGGIPVAIINSPVKVGWQQNKLYLEAYAPLEEHSGNFDANLPGIVHAIVEKTAQQPVLVDWQLVSFIAEERDGLAHDVAMKIN